MLNANDGALDLFQHVFPETAHGQPVRLPGHPVGVVHYIISIHRFILGKQLLLLSNPFEETLAFFFKSSQNRQLQSRSLNFEGSREESRRFFR